MRRIPFVELDTMHTALRGELTDAFARVLASDRLILGEQVDAFEEEFARYCEARHCVGVGTGLDALALALRALDVGEGDEVVVPAHTFVATWLAVTQVGAIAVPVEPDDTMNIDAVAIEQVIGPRTRAIVAVHLYGVPAEMDTILAIGRKHGIPVIEDAAQAHGARYRGRRIGSLGAIGAFSFYPTKNLGALGDGGAIVTNDGAIAERVRLLRNYGSRTKYHHEVSGTNSRLDELQAAFLRVKLPYLDGWNAARRALADRYCRALAGAGIRLPAVPQDVEACWHLFVIRTGSRDAMRASLAEAGVDTGVHYPVPPHRQPAYPRYHARSLPRTEQLAREVLSLPMHAQLGPRDVDDVARLVGAAAS